MEGIKRSFMRTLGGFLAVIGIMAITKGSFLAGIYEPNVPNNLLEKYNKD